MKSIKILILALAAGLLAACGGGSSSGSDPTDVTLSAQVYDQEIANAEVSVYVGDNEVATTTTDAEGNYSVDLQVSEEARAQRCVVVARRDSTQLRSLLGNVGSITDTATDNGGSVSSNELPSANVTNVSSAVAAVIEANGGTLPDSQDEIDAALQDIAGDSTKRDNVVKIAAAIKAVVDYNGNVSELDSAITNTEELAKALAESDNVAGEVDTVVASSDADSTEQLEQEVEGDSTLASQIPTEIQTLINGLEGNTYVTSNTSGEATLLAFQAGGGVTVADYTDIEAGGIDGTYTDNGNETVTITLTDPELGEVDVGVTVTGGSANAITTDVVFDGQDEGPHTLRRIIPVSAIGTSDADNIDVGELAGLVVVDVADSSLAEFDTACDGTADNVSLLAADGQGVATCDTALGMLVIDDGIEKSMIGLLPSSWDGTAFSQKLNLAYWENDTDLGGVASYYPVYQPIDNGAPSHDMVLRLYPDSGDGSVGAQLRVITQADNPGDDLAEGKLDLYNYIEDTYSAKTKQHIVGTTHSFTGNSLTINGSINEGQIDNSTTFWADSPHGSVAIAIALGNTANNDLQAVLHPNRTPVSMRTRYVYPLEPIVADDVSGKTFDFTDLIYDESGTITFNDDGSVELNEDGTDGSETASWLIAGAPQTAEMTQVADGFYGETLKIQWGDTTDYLFANKDADSTLVVGGYYTPNDGSNQYQENVAVILTEQ